MADYSKIIAEADGDLPFGDCVSADINYRKELVIEYIATDYRTEIERKKLATVDRDDIAKMAAFMNVPIEQLPQRILDECISPYYIERNAFDCSSFSCRTGCMWI